MAEVYKPSSSSLSGSTRPLDETRCKARVWSKGRWPQAHQCAFKPVKDGWCKTHHPDKEKARRDAADAKYEAQMRKLSMGWYGELMMEALIKIRDGDNDPRATADQALKAVQARQRGQDL